MRARLTAACVLVLTATAFDARAAGFALFEHGNKAMAMGGAFAAVADDPSAAFWNPAGLAFQTDAGVVVQGGVTLIRPVQEFEGANPFPGDRVTAEQQDQIFPPPHLYTVIPVGERSAATLAVTSPFGLGSWWEDDFSGRFISKRGDMRTLEVAPIWSSRLGDSFAVAAGVRYMAVQVDLTRDIPVVDPYTQSVISAGQVHLSTDGLANGGWGWTAGVMWQLGAGFSLGASYRSGIDVTIDEAEASFVQYSTGRPDLDAAIAAQLPFDRNIAGRSEIDFPDLVSVGLAWTGEAWTVSGQWGRMGWSSFQELPLTFPERPDLDSVIPERYRDVNQYRLGTEYRPDDHWALRAGLVYDETPQPPQSMSPLLPDGDREGVSAGFGWSGDRLSVDAALFYLSLERRFTTREQFDNFVGTYEGEAWLGGVTFGYRF